MTLFLFLSKFLPQFVYPVGIITILLLLALFLRKKEKAVFILLLVTFLVLFVSGNRWVSMALARTLEWKYLTPDPLPQADAIVVLGGATEAPEYPRTMVEFNSAADRIFKAAEIYQQGAAEHILLSGGGYIVWLDTRTLSQAQEMADILELLGVPEDALWLEEESANTYENALFSKDILSEKGIKRIYLVTSAMHMPRSVALFEYQGFEVVPVPADYSVTQASWDKLFHGGWETTLLNMVPNASSIKQTSNVMKEYIGLIVYRLKGWL